MASADHADPLRSRVRLVGGALLVGTVLGVVGAGAGAAMFSLGAVRTVFAFGALVFAFGLLGWSGSIMAGRGIETMHKFMDTGSNWTEEKSRRAMARVGGGGAGVMVGSGVVDALLVV